MCIGMMRARDNPRIGADRRRRIPPSLSSSLGTPKESHDMTTTEERRDVSRLETIPSCRGFASSLLHLISVVTLAALLVRVVLGRRCQG